MPDRNKSKEQLLEEITKYRGRILTLEKQYEEYSKAKDELQEISDRYSKLFHNSNDGIFIHDTEGNIIDINQKALEQFGYSKSEILTHKISDLHPLKQLKYQRKHLETLCRINRLRLKLIL